MAQPDRKCDIIAAHENLLIIEDRNLDDDSCKSYNKGSFLGKGGFARCY